MVAEPREGWEVRFVPAYRAHKQYTCPGCHNPIPEGEGHVVAWEPDFADDRRHWHKHCWRIEVRRFG